MNTDMLHLFWDPPYSDTVMGYVLSIDPLVRLSEEDVKTFEVSSSTYNLSLDSLKAGRTYEVKVHSVKNGRPSISATLLVTMRK